MPYEKTRYPKRPTSVKFLELSEEPRDISELYTAFVMDFSSEFDYADSMKASIYCASNW